MDVLREYLYVDFEKVKGLASQLYEGIPETLEESRKDTGRKQLGSRYIGYLAKDRETDIVDRKLIADALFPAIERDLEAEQYLEDISDIVSNAEKFTSGEIAADFPPGCIVRISSLGRLVDPRYFSRTMTGFSTAVNGFVLLDGKPENSHATPGKARKPTPRSSATLEDPEDCIPELPDGFFPPEDEVKTSTLRGMTKIMRGIYPDGLSMVLSPTGVGGPGISVRLQEGRQHLDADPQTLFARYGLGLQEWTIVGTIGHHASEPDNTAVVDAMDGTRINRGKLTAMVNNFLESMSTYGLVEMPQAPGFSIVPIAVYRVVPRSIKSRANEEQSA